MKSTILRKLSSSICFVLLSLACVSSAYAADTLKVLAIGNSFSVDAVNQNLHEISAEAGKNIIIGNLYIGGCSLERHWNSLVGKKADYTYHKIAGDGVLNSIKAVEITKGIFDEDWDIVTLQESSRVSGIAEKQEPYLDSLVTYLRANLPKAKLYWHQTWAYAVNSTHSSFPKYNCDQKEMYDKIMSCSSEACKKYGFTVIPVGTCIQNLRTSYIGENVNRDGQHLSMLTGRYAAALTWFATLFGEDPHSIKYTPKGMYGFQAEAAREAAALAVAKPFSTTSMKNFVSSADPERSTALALDECKNRKAKIALLEKEVFGTVPEAAASNYRAEVIRKKKSLWEGKAEAREVLVYYSDSEQPFEKKGMNCFRLLVVLPTQVSGTVPVYLVMNGRGNHCVSAEQWVHKQSKKEKEVYKIFDDKPKGYEADEWKLDDLLDSGCGFATFYFGDITADFDGAASRGIQRCFPKKLTWGSLAAWAWAYSRAMDYLETEERVDCSRVTLKTDSVYPYAALWAAAKDKRFSIEINADLAADSDYETHPYWYCKKYYKHSAVDGFNLSEVLSSLIPASRKTILKD